MITELAELVRNGNKTKLDMRMDLFRAEQKLFDYQVLLENNPCKRIIIEKNEIVATFDFFDEEINMLLSNIDYSSVPAQILSIGFYELEETEMVMKLIRFLGKNPVVLDVGANLGWYGLLLKKKMAEVEIYSFEPVPTTVEILKRNYALNNYSTDKIYCCGMYKENTIHQFYYDITESGASSMADLREKNTTRFIDVNMIRMDDFVREHSINSVDFIKCDVEGSELFVYQGGLETINKYKPIVFSEMLRKWSAKFDYHPNDIIDLFRGIGYQCYVINNGQLKMFGRVDEETVETNYFFLHPEKHCEIINELT